MIVVDCIVALVSGAAYEACSVGFIHYSERGRPLLTATFSMIQAAAEVAGIGESLHDMRAAPFFVLGYGIGTYTAVAWKSRRSG